MDAKEPGGIARGVIGFVADLAKNGILKVLGYCSPKGPGRAAGKKPKKSGETLYRIEF